ncbi:MAG: tRNA (cytosine(32)/uridine(32)-2'-O)-methyltransferase TrmJ [Acidiferrobacterales bacterium]
MNLENIRIVLVNTSHAGNIGATARAMKNMNLSQLFLVDPADFPSSEATARATGAGDVLANATICDTLEEAIAGCRWVVGTTARQRRIGWPTLSPRAIAAEVVNRAVAAPVALVFGRERMGLTNEEVDKCQALVSIPGNADFCSLNVASAVQILTYEFHLASLDSKGLLPTESSGRGSPSSADELERFYEELEKVLIRIDFLDPDNPRKLMRRLRRMFGRTDPDNNELNILRGILTAIQQTQHWHG